MSELDLPFTFCYQCNQQGCTGILPLLDVCCSFGQIHISMEAIYCIWILPRNDSRSRQGRKHQSPNWPHWWPSSCEVTQRRRRTRCSRESFCSSVQEAGISALATNRAKNRPPGPILTHSHRKTKSVLWEGLSPGAYLVTCLGRYRRFILRVLVGQSLQQMNELLAPVAQVRSSPVT